MAIHSLGWQDAAPHECRTGAVTIGNFDGVHRGHTALLAAAGGLARAVRGPAVAVTFDPHPIFLLRPDSAPPMLTTPEDRAALLQAAGVDHVVILRTTPDLLRLGAREFFERVVQGGLAARALAEGVDFAFGRNREGDTALLTALCREAKVDCVVVPPVLVNGRAVSSSAVRGCLDAGRVRDAAELLGRPYRLRGTVVVGQRRGNTLGFPTANLGRVATLVPAGGVYAVRAFHEGRAWPAAANIGANPTFAEREHKIEIHLIGFQGDLYGRELAIEFVDRLRDTRPFRGVDELLTQLREDVGRAQAIIDSSEGGPK
jgi:riboflavin kinase/FMN adenylyltransferase